MVCFLEKGTTLRPSPIVARNFLGSKSDFFLAGTVAAINDFSWREDTLENYCRMGVKKGVHFCSEFLKSAVGPMKSAA
jgi:hypothetical protein